MRYSALLTCHVPCDKNPGPATNEMLGCSNAHCPWFPKRSLRTRGAEQRHPPGNLGRCTSVEFMVFLIKSLYFFSNNLFLKLKCQLSPDLSSLLPPGSLPPSFFPSLLSFLPSIHLSIICYLSKHPSFPLKYQCLPKHGAGHWTTKVNKTVMVLLSRIVQSDGKQASTQVVHHHTAQQCNGKKEQSIVEA